MLRDAFFLTRRDLSYLLRRKETLIWTFLMPIVFFYFIGSATGGYGRSEKADPIHVVTSADSGFLAGELVKRLEQRHYRMVDNPNASREIRIPAGFTATVLSGKPAKVEFVRHGSDVAGDYDDVRIRRAVYTVLADLATVSANGEPTPQAFSDLAKQPRNITLDVSSAGKRRAAPVGFSQAVPGVLVMFILLVLFTSGGVSLAVERRQGILRRLASSPMSRGAVVLGKFGARFALAIVQILFAMLTGTVLFKVQWGDHLGAVILLLASYASLAALLGLLLGNFGKSDGQVVGLGVIASNVMAALGGCWWPIEIVPRWAQHLALLFPTGWAMDGLHKLMSFGDSPVAVLPHIAVFTLASVVAGVVLAKKFRFQ